QVGVELPGRPAVEALVDAAVAPHQVVIGVLGVDPDGVAVHVLGLLAEPAQRFPAVVGDLDIHVHDVDTLGVLGVHDEVGVILGLGVEFVAALPGRALVGAAENAAFLVDGLDDGIDHVGVGRRHGQADAAQVFGGQTGLQLGPGGTGVGGFIQRT